MWGSKGAHGATPTKTHCEGGRELTEEKLQHNGELSPRGINPPYEPAELHKTLPFCIGVRRRRVGTVGGVT